MTTVHPFTQLFVEPVAKTKFKKSDTACTPQQPKQLRTWKIYMSRQDTYEIEIEAGTFSDACTKALAKVRRDTGKDDWEVDHYTANLSYPAYKRR